MNKKGFTLIELLAVIVILAIIALIATPIILNMINSAKKSSARSAALGYIDAIEYNNGFAEIEQPGYTLVTGSNIDVSNINVKLKGKKPSSGTVTVNSKGKVESADDLCFNGYAVDYDGKDAKVKGKCNSEPTPATQPEAFATDSWTTIANNTTSSKYEVGDERELKIDVDEDGEVETYHLMIVNMSQCTTETSESACGMVIQFKELLKTKTVDDQKMNLENSFVGGWPSSRMYDYLNTTIYNKLPNDLKSVIKTTKVISGHEKNAENNYTSYDKLYLLSRKEAGFKQDKDSAYEETRKMDYYNENNKDDALRQKNIVGTMNLESWWLRTASYFETNDCYKSGAYGNSVGNNPNVTGGVSPVFRVGVN